MRMRFKGRGGLLCSLAVVTNISATNSTCQTLFDEGCGMRELAIYKSYSYNITSVMVG